MREPFRSLFSHYALAVVAVVAAVGVRWLLDPWLGGTLTLVTLFPAVAFAVWIGGAGPALLATALGYLGCDYLIIGLPGELDISSAAGWVGLLAYLFSCSVIIFFGEQMRAARRAAAERQESLRITLASIGDAVITTDVDGRVARMNAVAEALTGWKQHEALAQPLETVFRIVEEQTRRTVESPAVRALREGAIVGLANHTVLIAKDAMERPIDDSAAPIRDELGRVSGCVLVFRDVTERRLATLALQRSERELADFFENAPVALHRADPNGIVLRVNEAELVLLGYTREEYVGRSFCDFHVDRQVAEDILARLRRNEAVREQPATLRRKDGTLVEVLIGATAFFEDGELVHTRCFTLDVTDRKRAAEARERLAAIVADSDDAIASKTLHGIIRTWNAAAERLFGYTAAEAVGQSIELIIPPELRGEERTILERLRRGERIDHFETVRVAKDGRRIDISLTVSPIRDENGAIVGASKVARDVTERKRAAEALREADRRKTEFLAMLAHELRNPLAPIRHSLEIMKRTRHDQELALRARETIERQVTHMVRLVDDLLDVSRITRDKLELVKGPVELAPILQQAIETCRALAEREGHTLEVSPPPRAIRLDADPVRLAQVFSNLLDNACKYSLRGTRIRIGTETQGNDVLVSVIDEGIGIPADALDSIFEMFAQVDPTRERSRGGLGIGLTLVKRLVELHGGSIAVRSAGVGKGSTFVVRLPMLAGTPADDGAPTPDAVEAPAARRILVVDDNEDSARSLATLLGLQGHATEVAHDGVTAVEMAERFRPDVVLLDIGLPGIDGFDACRRIRAQPWGRGVAIVALTGWGQDADRHASKAAGFDGHLVKPVDNETLTELLAKTAHPARRQGRRGT